MSEPIVVNVVPVKGVVSAEEAFRQYMLAEYNIIAEAHFKVNEAIGTFFRNYLTILAVPIGLVGVIAGLSTQQELVTFVSRLRFLIVLVSFAIATVGLFVLLYIISLRMDSILYARVVNA